MRSQIIWLNGFYVLVTRMANMDTTVKVLHIILWCSKSVSNGQILRTSASMHHAIYWILYLYFLRYIWHENNFIQQFLSDYKKRDYNLILTHLKVSWSIKCERLWFWHSKNEFRSNMSHFRRVRSNTCRSSFWYSLFVKEICLERDRTSQIERRIAIYNDTL